jgi:hypothetical protein
MPTTQITALLAQNAGLSIAETIRQGFEKLLTPAGAAGALLGVAVIAAVLLRRNGLFVGATIVVFLMTMMQHDSRYFDNTLITPLQQLRDLSKIATFAMLFGMLGNMVLHSSTRRERVLIFPAIAFFLFQTFYLARLGFQNDPLRAGLGWFTCLMVLTTFTIGLGRRIQNDADFDRFVRIFGHASLLFIGANLLQLALGYRQAIADNRLAGISGNAQLAGYVSAVFTLTNVYLFTRTSLASPSRWIYGASIGVLGLLLIWTGSRTGVLCAGVGLMAFYRVRLGSLAILAMIGSVVLFALASLFAESFDGVSRFVEGANTRREVWAQAWSDFLSAPVFGTIGNYVGDTPKTIESSYLATLQLLGIVGAVPLVVSVGSIITLLPKSLFARWSRTVHPEQADLLIAAVCIVLAGSIFEAFFLGILSFSVVWLYALFAIGAYVVERARTARTVEVIDDVDVDEVPVVTQSN